jgi:dienelactone hydrolase
VGRTELLLSSADGDAIPVTVWYPASGRGGGARLDAPLAAAGPAPVILYAPGWYGTRTQSSNQVENLASHGFVVIACDDVASDAATDPDHGASFDFTSDAATEQSIERAHRHVERQAALLQDIFAALAADSAGQFSGRLNLDRIAVLGYSIGGAAGVQLASRDARVVAVFNVDGGLFGPAADLPAREAYFLMSSSEAFLPHSDLTSPEPAKRNNAIITARDNERQARRAHRANGYWAAIDSANHADLSDALFAPTRRNLLRSPFERRGVSAALRAYQVAFFRAALLGEDARLLSGRPPNQYVRWVTPTSAASGAASAHR